MSRQLKLVSSSSNIIYLVTQIGITGTAYKWLSSFITNRTS